MGRDAGAFVALFWLVGWVSFLKKHPTKKRTNSHEMKNAFMMSDTTPVSIKPIIHLSTIICFSSRLISLLVARVVSNTSDNISLRGDAGSFVSLLYNGGRCYILSLH